MCIEYLLRLKKWFTDSIDGQEGSVGEVSIQVDLFTHPGTGEHKVTVKGTRVFKILKVCDYLVSPKEALLIGELIWIVIF